MAGSLGSAVLELSTDDKKFDAGLKSAEGKTKSWASSVGSVAKGAALAIAGVGAAALGIVGSLTASALAVSKQAGEVSKLKRELGVTAQEASKLSYAGKRLGLDTDELSKSFGILAKDIQGGGEKLGEYGMKVVRAKDGNVDFNGTLGGIADRFKAMPDGVQKTALAMDLFGKSGKDMIPFLNQGKDGLKALGDQAERLGLVIDDKTIAASKRYNQAQKDLSDVTEGLKNKLGMAFLPVLADVAVAFMGWVNGVLPAVVRGVDLVTGGIKTAIGVAKDMVAAFQGKQQGGGDFLAGLIGSKSADAFMKLVSDVGGTVNHWWETAIKPAFKWLEDHVPPAWETVQQAVAKAWSMAKPKLEAFVEKLEDLRAKFDSLPGPVKEWAAQTAVATAVVKATGLDQTLLSIIAGLSGMAQGAAAVKAMLAAAAIGVVGSIAIFFTLIAVIGTVILVIHNWDEGIQGIIRTGEDWGRIFSRLGTETKKTFEGWGAIFSALGTAANAAFVSVLNGVIGLVNGAIEKLNGLIEKLNLIPGVKIPLIAKLDLISPDLPLMETALNHLARDRQSTIYVDTVTRLEHRGLTGGGQSAGGGGGGGGGGTALPQSAPIVVDNNITLEIDGREVFYASEQSRAQEARLAGVMS